MGASTVKLRNPEHSFGLDEENDRRLPCVRSLHLIREDRYGGFLKCIALEVRRFYLNNSSCLQFLLQVFTSELCNFILSSVCITLLGCLWSVHNYIDKSTHIYLPWYI